MSDQPTKTIGAKALRQLCSTRKGADERAAEERGAWGSKFKDAQEKHGVDAIAFGMAYRLWKMADTARASRILRNFTHYIDLLEVGGQTDIEDAAGGQGDVDYEEGDEVDVVGDIAGEGALRTFQDAITGTDDVDGVRVGLERFLVDHPDLADGAREFALQRIEELNAEQGGGEDLRPDTLRNKSRNDVDTAISEAGGPYSNKQNAVRAARRKAGIENPEVYEEGGGWYFRPPVATHDAPVAHQ